MRFDWDYLDHRLFPLLIPLLHSQIIGPLEELLQRILRSHHCLQFVRLRQALFSLGQLQMIPVLVLLVPLLSLLLGLDGVFGFEEVLCIDRLQGVLQGIRLEDSATKRLAVNQFQLGELFF